MLGINTPAAHASCNAGETMRRHRRRRFAAVLGIGAAIVFGFATKHVNSEGRMPAISLIDDLRSSHALDAVENVSVYLVPDRVLFRTAVNPETLQRVSCVYSAPKFLTSKILSLLEHSIKSYRTPANTKIDLRLGIVFRGAGNNVLEEFYFQDFGGKHDVEGFSREYSILASADILNRFRTFITANRVDLIARPNNSSNSNCP